MNRGRLTVGHQYRWLSGFSAWADAEAIQALMSDPEVLSIDIDRIAYASLTQGAALVGATSVQSLGVTGSGVTVAVLDTGIDTDHPDLSANLIAEACFCDNTLGPLGCCPDGSDMQIGSDAAEDDDGHGTQSAGVIVSNSITNQGIAPDASVVAIKVLNAAGSGNFSDVADGLDWVIDNRLALGIKVVNLSLGDLVAYDDSSAFPCTGSNTADAIAQLKNLGVSVFVASGNSGFDDGIAFPACVPEAISVGSVYDASFPSVSWCGATCSTIVCTDEPALADSLVCNTNSGSLLDILAPQFQATVPTTGGGTISVGGTSISSPYAAGQAALLLEADPSLTPDQILSSLEIGAPMVTNPTSGLSFPRTRVDLAVAQLLAVCGNGALEAGEACDDNNTVSGDCCSAICELEMLGSVCDDGLFCNSGETCAAGVCAGGSAIDCSASADQCNAGICNEAAGACQASPINEDAACDDGLFCNSGETCAAGVCAGGSAIDCSASADQCNGGVCNEAAGACQASPINEDAACDDGLFCNSGETCAAGVCAGGSATDCSASADQCNGGVCNESAAVCQASPINEGAACDDLDACMVDDMCFGGVCTSGSTLDCDDLDECTADGCDEVTGCFHEAIVGCTEPPLVPALPLSGLVLLVGIMLVAALWAVRIDPDRVESAIHKS
jgi:cysteine-rich repeat protein